MKLKNYKGTSFNEFFEKQLKNKEFKKEWDEYDPEYQVMKEIVRSRLNKNLSQKELSLLTGIAQAEISKIENGERNTSIKLLNRIANAMDMELRISFVPKVSK